MLSRQLVHTPHHAGMLRVEDHHAMPYHHHAGRPAAFILILAPALVLLAAVPGAMPVRAQRPACGAFATQADAQRAYRADPAGLAHLDANHDGIACESNPCPCDATPADVAPPTPAPTTPPPAAPVS